VAGQDESDRGNLSERVPLMIFHYFGLFLLSEQKRSASCLRSARTLTCLWTVCFPPRAVGGECSQVQDRCSTREHTQANLA
jgi:hypothetical protein